MPYADPDDQREACAAWYRELYNEQSKRGREFREAELERKREFFANGMSEEAKDAARERARIGMAKIRARRKKLKR